MRSHRSQSLRRLDEPQKHYTKLKKPDTKGHILSDSIYMKYPEERNHRHRKKTVGARGWVERGKGSNCLMNKRFLFGVMKMFRTRPEGWLPNMGNVLKC